MWCWSIGCTSWKPKVNKVTRSSIYIWRWRHATRVDGDSWPFGDVGQIDYGCSANGRQWSKASLDDPNMWILCPRDHLLCVWPSVQDKMFVLARTLRANSMFPPKTGFQGNGPVVPWEVTFELVLWNWDQRRVVKDFWTGTQRHIWMVQSHGFLEKKRWTAWALLSSQKWETSEGVQGKEIISSLESQICQDRLPLESIT